ncbi:DoxX family protein [Glycomyces tenuis]|uniref:DoxX family protein n=1 Tax=Glycomyces tenuis TaxID=58116 RepID=UPI0004225ADE|nr:DoxX family protein [Glycomyces tenuis]
MSTDTPAPENTTAGARPGRALNITLWILQGVLGAFFVIASAAPKLFGQSDAVEGFEVLGAGDWFRILIGVLELAGGIGLVVPRLSGLAAIGLGLLMIGAAYTNAFIVDGYWPVATPLILLVIVAFIAWGRRGETRRLFTREG